jgi:PhzF family phenazine biosynthesis protein
MSPHIWIVNAFITEIDRVFTGNPAAVVLLPDDRPEPDTGWMQQVAEQMNLSETAFVRRIHASEKRPDPAAGENAIEQSWTLRWFTPSAEVELCGHATLATAHALMNLTSGSEQPPSAYRFITKFRGELLCHAERDGRVSMDFPADKTQPTEPPESLIDDLNLKCGQIRAIAKSRYDWLVELQDIDGVKSARPDFQALAEIDCRGVMITAADEKATAGQPDIVSRFFAPRLRIAEDPVTGSAHCVLGPYWRERLGKDRLDCEQASPRGGRLTVEMIGQDRVALIGRAATIMQGQFEQIALPDGLS